MNKPAAMPAPVTDTALRGFLGYTLRRASNGVMADAARTLEPLGLRVTTFSALALICDQPGVTQSLLAAALHMERSNIVLIVDALEQAGWIGRHRMEHDRRSYALRATPEGLETRDAALAALRAHEEKLFSRMSAEERAHLIDLLQKIELPD